MRQQQPFCADGLSDKKRRFVEEYLVDLCATQAAIRAGYSKKTAKQQGSRLLTNVDVQNVLKTAMKARATQLSIAAEEVLQEVAKVAYGDAEVYGASVKVRALELLMRHLGILDVDTPGGSEAKPQVVMVLKGVSMDDL